MPYNIFQNFSVEFFGASHSDNIGVTIKNLPYEALKVESINCDLNRRKSGNNPWSTPRVEDDKVSIVANDDKKIVAVIENQNKRSGDYKAIKDTPRPSHADYAAKMKFGLSYDMTGGGKFSGRMTAPLVIAGNIAKQRLNGIKVLGYVSEIDGIKGNSFTDTEFTMEMLENVRNEALPVFGEGIKEKMTQRIIDARAAGDSVGGVVDCIVFGLSAGYGDALFEGLEGRIAAAVFGIPAVKAVEFGLGKGFAEKKGSEANDPFYMDNGIVRTKTNNNGGINGGISNGMPITLRVTFKPTPSIALPQRTVNLATDEDTEITIKGRHDACIVPRAVVVVESAVALAILDIMLGGK